MFMFCLIYKNQAAIASDQNRVTPLSLTKKFCDRQCNLVSTFASFTDTTYTDKKSV